MLDVARRPKEREGLSPEFESLALTDEEQDPGSRSRWLM